LILKVNIDGLGVYKMLLFHPRKSKKAVSPLEAKIFLTQSANFTQLKKIQWMRDW
jgi:hypothetical protein